MATYQNGGGGGGGKGVFIPLFTHCTTRIGRQEQGGGGRAGNVTPLKLQTPVRILLSCLRRRARCSRRDVPEMKKEGGKGKGEEICLSFSNEQLLTRLQLRLLNKKRSGA